MALVHDECVLSNRTKRGDRFFPPDAPQKWNVGVRLGAKLRRALHDPTDSDGSTDVRMRPHVRRAHWHRFWTGPRKSTERKLRAKWLPPTPVNVASYDELPSVVRPVTGA